MSNKKSESIKNYLIGEDDKRYNKNYREGWNDCLCTLLDTHTITKDSNQKTIDIHFNLELSDEMIKKYLE